MGKSKYETHVLPHLDRITEWAQAGATAKDIAAKLHVAYSTFRKYLDDGKAGDERYMALSAAFTQACEVPDEQVENALFKRACGYRFEEITTEEKLDRNGDVRTLTKKVIRDIPPDPTSAMFWMTNRRPERWKYKPDEQGSESDEGGVVMLAPVMDEPKEGGTDG